MKKKLKNLCKVVLLSTAVSLPTLVGVNNIFYAVDEYQQMDEIEKIHGSEIAKGVAKRKLENREDLPDVVKAFTYGSKLVLEHYKE